MKSTIAHSGGVQLTADDVVVPVVAIAATAFPQWWELAGQFTLDGLRALILVASAIYVVVRTVNEIQKILSSKDHKE